MPAKPNQFKTIDKYSTYVKDRYNIDIDEFLSFFLEGKSQRWLARHYGVTRDIVRYIGYVLGLDWVDRTIRDNIEKAETKFDNQIYIENQKLKAKISVLNKELSKAKQFIAINTSFYEYFENKLNEYDFSRVFKNIPLRIHQKFDYNYHDFIVLSDWHVGEKVDPSQVGNEYNLSVVEQRVDKLIELAVNNRKSSVIHMLLLGDFVEGGHQEELLSDEANIFEYVMFVYDQIVKMVKTFLSYGYSKVNLYSVVGNHSRIKPTKYYKNKYVTFESFVYAMLDKTVKYLDNVSSVFFKNNFGSLGIFDNSHIIAFAHGDFVKSINSIDNDVTQSLHNQLYGKNFNSYVIGHFHRPMMKMNAWGGYYIINGCLKGVDEYGAFNGYAPLSPVQIMFSVDKKYSYEFNFLKL